MRELLVGIVGVTILSVIFGLVSRHASARPRAGCAGCALASACDHRGSPEAGEECRVEGGPPGDGR